MTTWVAERAGIDGSPRHDAGALLPSGLERLEDGFGIFDSTLTLVVGNEPFRSLCAFPQDLCEPRVPLDAMGLRRPEPTSGRPGR